MQIQQQYPEQTNEKRLKQQQPQPNWNQFNYPPLLNLFHFRPYQLPQDKKKLVMMLFSVHIAILILTLLNFIDNCIQNGIQILYSFLFFIIFNQFILFLFYRSYIGLVRNKAKITLFLFLFPISIITEIFISIVNFLGFNGYVKVSFLLRAKHILTATISIFISIGYDLVALFSIYLCYQMYLQKTKVNTQLLESKQ